MPTIFTLYGLRFFFYADDHAKIEVSPRIRVVYNKGLKASGLKRAEQLAEERRAEIIEVWHRYH